MTVVYLRPMHPLRPLGLAVSTRLSDPIDVVAEFVDLPWHRVRPEDASLLEAAHRAASALIECADLFRRIGDPLRASASPAFISEARAAEVALAEVIVMPWPEMPEGSRRQALAAYADVAMGLEMLASGSVPRPDVPSFLTNLTKAIASIPDHRITWDFGSLPRFA